MGIRFAPKTVGLAVLSAVVVTTVNHAAAPGAAADSEAIASSTTAAAQQTAVVARAANGDYVVAWAGNGTGDTDGIFFQRRSARGDAVGAEVLVNTTTAGAQQNPAVAINPTASFGVASGSSASGTFVVAWESADAGGLGVYYRVYNADGTPATAQTAANTAATANDQSEPSVAMSTSGTFVIAWQSLNQAPDSSGSGIFFRRYDAAGAAQGSGESLANTYTALSQANPSAAMESNGDFVIVWQSNQQLSAGEVNDIFGQRFAANGNTAGTEFQVNATTAGEQTLPSVGMDVDGDFVASWQGASASNGLEIYARPFDEAGSPGSEFVVNTTASGDQTAPVVGVGALGDFAVAWQSGTDLYARLYDDAAAALSAETAVNSSTSGTQQKPAIGADADGDFLVAWESDHSDAAFNVYMRRFAGAQTVDVTVAKVDTEDPVQAGTGTVSYRITVANTAAPRTDTGIAAVDAALSGASGVTFTDTVPAELTAALVIAPDVAANWTCAENPANVVTCRYKPVLAPGESKFVDISAAAPVSQGEITNTVVVSADQDADAPAANTATQKTALCLTADAGSVGFSGNVTQAETSAAGGVDATITVSRTPGPCVPAVSVQYETLAAGAGGSTAEASDFTPASGTLTWAANDIDDKTFTVHVNFDTVDEPDDTVALMLKNPDRADIDTGTATLTITDDDAAPNVTLAVNPATIAEAGAVPTDVATFTATLAALSEQTATVNLAFSGTAARGAGCGTAQALPDYTCSGTAITIDPGELSDAVTVVASQDTTNEPDETIVADISTTSNATEATAQTATTTIVDDDDLPTVQFSVTSGTIDEEDAVSSGTPVQVTVTLSAQNSAPTTVNFSVGGTATATTDFTVDTDTGTAGLQGSPLTIPANTSSATITLNAVNDAINEDRPVEDIVLTITSTSANATVGTNAVHTRTFTEDEAQRRVTFSADTAITETNAGTQNVTVTATLTDAGGAAATDSAAVDVPFTISGDANASYDHTAASCLPDNCKITIAAGQTTGTYSYNVSNDVLDDNDTETVTMTMNLPSYVSAGAKTTHTTTITDNDFTAMNPPDLNFSSASQSVAETLTSGSVNVQLQVANGRPGGLSVPFTVGGTAGAADYTLDTDAGTGGNQGSPIVIADGAASATIAFAFTDDDVDEPNETVTLTLGNASNADEVTPTTHTVTIQDDDDFPEVVFDSAAQTVVETDGTTTLTVLLSRSSSQDVNVPFSILVGMASDASAADYTIDTNAVTPGNQGSPVTIPAGLTEATITIGIVNDAADEDDQTLRLAMGTPTNATAGTPSTHTVTIQDDNVNDPLPTVTLTINPGNGQFAEQVGTATVNATLSNPTERNTSVALGLQLVNGTASASDYTASGTTLTIPANGTATTATTPVTLTGTADTVDEADETLSVQLSTVSANASEATPQAVAATVVDDDGSYSIDDVAVVEGNSGTSTATFTVTRTPSGYPTTISYTTTPGTAVEGSDYLDKTGTLSFPASAVNSTQSIVVTINGDILDEANETYTVTLSNASGGTIADAIGAGTITDNDTAGVSVTESSGSTAVTEGGASDTVSVVLTSQPTANVTITISASSELQVSPSTLTFTPANYATPQAVTVSAVNDQQVEGAHGGTIGGTATSTDANYNGSLGILTVAITDNDAVTAGDNAPAVVVTVTGGTVTVTSNGSEGGGGAFSGSALMALLGLLGLRRRRGAWLLAALAAVAALPGTALAQAASKPAPKAASAAFSYKYADLRYISGDAKDPDVGLSGFSLAGSLPVKADFFVTGGYATAETDDFSAFGIEGSVKSTSFSIGGGMRRAIQPKLDATGAVNLVNSKAEGQGAFTGDTSDTGYAVEAGLRGRFNPQLEWGAALNYLAIFEDSSTSLNAQGLYHFNPNLALALGAGTGDSATQFNLGVRYNF